MKSNKVLFLLMTIKISAYYLGKVDKEKGIQFANQLRRLKKKITAT